MKCLSKSKAQRLGPSQSPVGDGTQRPSCAQERRRAALWAMTGLLVFVALLGEGLQAQQSRGAQAQRSQQSGRPGSETTPPKEITFTTRLDPTAIWVGDHFHYIITVDHIPNIEFVMDNLGTETTNMEPFQVVNVSHQVVPLKGGTMRLSVDITLSSFATGQDAQQIPQLTLFYFHRDRSGGGAAEAIAESQTIPGPVIALRSTLPPESTNIRDTVTVSDWPAVRWVLGVSGWVSLILLVAGVGWETTTYVRGARSKKGPDRRKAMDAVRARWASAVPSDFNDPDTVIAFHNQCYHDLKEYLGYYLEFPTLGLTADELQEEMQRLGTQSDFSQKVAGVLGNLETSRYSLNGSQPNPEVAQRTSQQIREIFASGSKG